MHLSRRQSKRLARDVAAAIVEVLDGASLAEVTEADLFGDLPDDVELEAWRNAWAANAPDRPRVEAVVPATPEFLTEAELHGWGAHESFDESGALAGATVGSDRDELLDGQDWLRNESGSVEDPMLLPVDGTEGETEDDGPLDLEDQFDQALDQAMPVTERLFRGRMDGRPRVVPMGGGRGGKEVARTWGKEIRKHVKLGKTLRGIVASINFDSPRAGLTAALVEAALVHMGIHDVLD